MRKDILSNKNFFVKNFKYFMSSPFKLFFDFDLAGSKSCVHIDIIEYAISSKEKNFFQEITTQKKGDNKNFR